jgi:hypothetical protein
MVTWKPDKVGQVFAARHMFQLVGVRGTPKNATINTFVGPGIPVATQKDAAGNVTSMTWSADQKLPETKQDHFEGRMALQALTPIKGGAFQKAREELVVTWKFDVLVRGTMQQGGPVLILSAMSSNDMEKQPSGNN